MMKKHVILITLLIVLGLGEGLAQSTYTQPYKGFKHNYTVSVTDDGTPLMTRWYVTDDEDNKLTQGEGNDYEISSTVAGAAWSAGDNALGGAGVYNVDITWGTSVNVGEKYYVVVEVDGTDTETCTNEMALEVEIGGDFSVVAYSLMGVDVADYATADEASGDVDGCPEEAVSPVWNGTNGHTDIGTTTVVFKIERKFSVLGWDFDYGLESDGNELTTLNNVTIKAPDNTTVIDGDAGRAKIITMLPEYDYALMYVTVNNVQGNEIAVDLVIQGTGNTKDTDDNVDDSRSEVEYRIFKIPEITGFSSGD